MCVLETKSQIQTYFDSQSHSSYNANKGAEAHVHKFCEVLLVFSDALLGFLKNQNFCGCAFTSLHPRPLHHCRNWPQDHVSRLHHCHSLH